MSWVHRSRPRAPVRCDHSAAIPETCGVAIEVPEIVFGLPDWVAVALGCYAASAVLNAIAWWFTEVSDEDAP